MKVFLIKFLSRYKPRYIRSLVYMLQASEYKVLHYFAWLHKVQDFGSVEKRKHLDVTAKALALLFTAGLMFLLGYAVVIYLFFFTPGPLNYLYGLLLLLIVPDIVAYGIVVPLFLLTVLVQKPTEFFIIRKAKKRLAAHPAKKIAVAGSYGKTSMREILKMVLSEGRRAAGPSLSHNTPIGISRFTMKLHGDEEILIFELGEYYPGDVRRLCELVGPDIGVITGVNEAHLEKFKTLEQTAKTVFELADYLADKPVYVNAENDLARKYAKSRHIFYDRTGVGDLKVENPRSSLDGTDFVLKGEGKQLEVKSKLLGLHQVGPLAAAVSLALLLGFSIEQIQQGISKTAATEHRLEPKVDSSGVVTLDDSYNGNPDGVKAVIDFLAGLKGHRRFYVTPGLVEMGDRTSEVHKQIGRQLAEAGIEKVVLIRNSVTGYIEQGLKDAGYRGEVIWFAEALQAFSALPSLTVSGDVVLLQNDWPDQYQ